MVATLAVVEYLGSSVSTVSATNLNLGGTMSANLDTATYPTSVGNYSYSKVFKLLFSGSFTSVSQIKIYKSSGEYLTGESISYGTSTTWHVPTGGSYQDSVATTAIPVSLPATANIPIGGSLGGTIATGESTDFIFLQASLTTQASSATCNQKVLTFTYAET